MFLILIDLIVQIKLIVGLLFKKNFILRFHLICSLLLLLLLNKKKQKFSFVSNLSLLQFFFFKRREVYRNMMELIHTIIVHS